MGFYHGSKRRRPSSQDTGPVITPREYTALLAGALRAVVGRQESDTCRPGVAEAGAAPGLLEGLSRRVRRQPDDPTGHRMLAIAHLYAGSRKPAVRHLEIAVNILLAQAATTRCLHRALCARLELALLVPVLVPLCLQLGKRETVRRLVRGVLLA